MTIVLSFYPIRCIVTHVIALCYNPDCYISHCRSTDLQIRNFSMPRNLTADQLETNALHSPRSVLISP